MWLSLVEEAQMREAIIQGGGMWDGRKVERLIEQGRERLRDSILGSSYEPRPAWVEPSAERVLARMTPADRAWVLASQTTTTG